MWFKSNSCIKWRLFKLQITKTHTFLLIGDYYSVFTEFSSKILVKPLKVNGLLMRLCKFEDFY